MEERRRRKRMRGVNNGRGVKKRLINEVINNRQSLAYNNTGDKVINNMSANSSENCMLLTQSAVSARCLMVTSALIIIISTFGLTAAQQPPRYYPLIRTHTTKPTDRVAGTTLPYLWQPQDIGLPTPQRGDDDVSVSSPSGNNRESSTAVTTTTTVTNGDGAMVAVTRDVFYHDPVAAIPEEPGPPPPPPDNYEVSDVSWSTSEGRAGNDTLSEGEEDLELLQEEATNLMKDEEEIHQIKKHKKKKKHSKTKHRSESEDTLEELMGDDPHVMPSKLEDEHYYQSPSAGIWGHEVLSPPQWSHYPKIFRGKKRDKIFRKNKPDHNKGSARIIASSHYELQYILGRKIIFLCVARGRPRPRITWYKDGVELYTHNYFQVHEWEIGRFKLKSKMEIDPATPMDAGYYKCEANNERGVDQAGFRTKYRIQ